VVSIVRNLLLTYTPIGYAHVMSTLRYSVPGVSCAHCQAAITDEVGALPGVEAVDVDLETKIVAVTGDPLDERAIIAAIDEAGYEVAQ
jgi:copper chaperone